MAATFTNLLLHIIFGTKNRAPIIAPEFQPRLYDSMGGVVRNQGGVLYEIGGMPDHLHLLVRWHTDEKLSALLRGVKSESSRWVKETFPQSGRFAWQGGYGASSVSQSQCGRVTKYIQNQAAHHAAMTFQGEFRGYLRAPEIPFHENLIWG